MKKYKVLEAHQGDKFYMPGDPETGTRIADENAVGHLVTLGLLEEIGDVPDAQPAPESADSALDALRVEVGTVTQERDDARADLNALGSVVQGERDAAEALRGQLSTVTSERDGLAEQLASVTAERDAHATRITELEAELAKPRTGRKA